MNSYLYFNGCEGFFFFFQVLRSHGSRRWSQLKIGNISVAYFYETAPVIGVLKDFKFIFILPN